jgi:DNA-binding LacI/PurR family transcriptional regulator
VNGTPNEKATIFEVAQAAGVSITTVSHAFSGKRRVNAATRERVLDVARRLSYAPNAKAKALATGRTLSLALQVSFTGEALLLNSFFAALLPALSLAAVERDYSFVYVPPSREGKEFVAPLVLERRVDGAVFVDPVLGDPFVEAVRGSEIPYVTIGGRFQDGSSDNWVDNDHASICAAVAAHLRRRGYERPALLTIDSDVSYVADYTAGFRRSFGSSRVVVADAFMPRAATAAVRDALRSDDPPDAFFCIHDQLAIAAEPAIAAEGLEIGRDVGVVGVGNSLFARQAHTPLTSVQVFPERFGGPAIEMLDALIAGRKPAAPVLIPFRIVSRASTLCH